MITIDSKALRQLDPKTLRPEDVVALDLLLEHGNRVILDLPPVYADLVASLAHALMASLSRCEQVYIRPTLKLVEDELEDQIDSSGGQPSSAS